MTIKRSLPCLPARLLKGFKNDPLVASHTMIYCEDMEAFRVSVLTMEVPLRAAALDKSPPSAMTRHFEGIEQGTYLHLAVARGDIPLAYECIRLGVSMNRTDERGRTPLLLATQMLADITLSQGNGFAGNDQAVLKTYDRVVRIAKLLIEQHAEVNVAVNNAPPLGHACQACEFELVELLMRHGAVPVILQVAAGLQHRREIRRLRSLMERTKAIVPRPSRPCPCWSGKLLADCHANAQPYPPDFLCFCDARKTFQKCCKRRDFKAEEAWEDQYQRIIVTSRPAIPGQFPVEFEEMMRNLTSHTFNGKIPMTLEQRMASRRMQAWAADTLLRRGQVDPAFAYAMKEVQFAPKPWEKALSKSECQIRVDMWNSAIDSYIARGTDPRPVRQIETSMKLGLDGGPMFKACENRTCALMVGSGIDKLKMCGGCKKTYYCSEECQRDDWKEHKKVCKDPNHTVQMLPSQRAYCEFMMGFSQAAITVFQRMATGEK